MATRKTPASSRQRPKTATTTAQAKRATKSSGSRSGRSTTGMTPKAVSSGHPSHDDDRTTEGAQIRREVGRAGAPAQGRELRSRGKQTMRRLLDAGIEVFARRGFHAARVDDIVKAAKTSHGTFYLYFANKEDLFEALVADVAEEMRGLADSLGPLRAGPEGRAELRAWLERFTTLYEHYGPILRTWTEAEIDQSELGRIGTDLLGQLALALSERVAATGAKGLDPAIAGLALVAMVERFNYFVLSGQVSADHDELLDTLASVLHDGLFSR